MPDAPSIAFATSAWQRDWRVVLDPRRFAMIVDSHQYAFQEKLVVLNNFADAATAAQAWRAAQGLVAAGLATHALNAPEYLTADRLQFFGLDAHEFQQRNPFFSTAHLAALH